METFRDSLFGLSFERVAGSDRVILEAADGTYVASKWLCHECPDLGIMRSDGPDGYLHASCFVRTDAGYEAFDEIRDAVAHWLGIVGEDGLRDIAPSLAARLRMAPQILTIEDFDWSSERAVNDQEAKEVIAAFAELTAVDAGLAARVYLDIGYCPPRNSHWVADSILEAYEANTGCGILIRS